RAALLGRVLREEGRAHSLERRLLHAARRAPRLRRRRGAVVIARARSLDKRYFGVVEATVEQVENDPDGEGKVKLKFPFFDDNTVSDWVRVRQLYAGSGYGAFFLPEKGTEVLVAFVHGDMRRPVVLGGLYNGKDKPPTKRTKQDDHKLIRTR